MRFHVNLNFLRGNLSARVKRIKVRERERETVEISEKLPCHGTGSVLEQSCERFLASRRD